MHPIDLGIFIAYMAGLLGVGFYFLKKNKSTDDFFVSSRNMSKWHIGLSVVATDVGGGFSIGLGGLGFIMGISGSWMLFTGLIGAWLSAVLLIPKVYKLGHEKKLTTFPQLFNHYYNPKVALVAGIISAIGYLGFTSSQILAGAKLAAASFVGLDIQTALLVMGLVTIIYTVMGGMTAVIYTDTVQWIVLMLGLILVGIPISYHAIGGWESIHKILEPELLSLSSIGWQQLVNWSITIIPIWFVGMTLYQRIYASRSESEAKKAWFIAGLFEWPIMAFMGVLLGLFSRVAAEQGMFSHLGFATSEGMDPELGLPLLLRQILPVGLMGIMMSAYFSAILSTADSCLMAASGNLLTDIIEKLFPQLKNHPKVLLFAQILTLAIGIVAIVLAASMENVLELMLYSYAFMVSGLLVPLIAAVFFGQKNWKAAIASMLSGGSTTIILTVFNADLPYGLDANIFGISISLLVFIAFTTLNYTRKKLQHENYTNQSG
ncbi:MAG TPA: sodium:solute symporter family protein [Bacteroidia bacterium]|nr:sodium:solute symporter family protein [Bacteroidia bacterium]HNS12304.1 sodium:solute symporter family protein [Bacteroidia bacterium]